jgi:hypothetical protein
MKLNLLSIMGSRWINSHVTSLTLCVNTRKEPVLLYAVLIIAT